MAAIDPNTTFGSIAVNVIATVIAAAILGGLAWVGGPLKWFVRNRQLRQLLHTDRQFVFVFNPIAGKGKLVTFLSDGTIGEGRNDNENTWKVSKGALEIFASDGKLYSRFIHDKASGLLKHTNDTDTRSIHGQYLQPEFMAPKSAVQPGTAADAPTARR
jgi:hypothetical protein